MLSCLDQPARGPVWKERRQLYGPAFRPFLDIEYSIPTERLQPGTYLLECYLDQVRRASYLFDLST